MIKNNKAFITVFTIIVILAPILNAYRFLNTSLSIPEILLMIIAVYGLITQKKLLDNKAYLLYCAYFVVCTLVMALTSFADINSCAVRIGRDLLYVVLILMICPQNFLFKSAVKWYILAAEIVCIFLFVQFIFHYVFNIYIPNLIPGTVLNYSINNQEQYYQMFQRVSMSNYRPSSFFLEPAQMAQYCAPAILVGLFVNRNENSNKIDNLRQVIIITVGVVLTRSAVGAVLCVLSWGMWLIKNVKSRRISIRKILICILVICAGAFALSSDMGQGVLKRLSLIGQTDIGEQSGSMRVIRGFLIYDQLPIINQIFGVGLGQIENAILHYGITTPFDIADSLEYMSTISYVLNSMGIIGLIMFTIALLQWRSNNSVSVRLILLFAVMMFSGFIYSTPLFLLMCAFISYKSDRQILQASDNMLVKNKNIVEDV